MSAPVTTACTQCIACAACLISGVIMMPPSHIFDVIHVAARQHTFVDLNLSNVLWVLMAYLHVYASNMQRICTNMLTSSILL